LYHSASHSYLIGPRLKHFASQRSTELGNSRQLPGYLRPSWQRLLNVTSVTLVQSADVSEEPFDAIVGLKSKLYISQKSVLTAFRHTNLKDVKFHYYQPKIYYFHNDITEVLYNAWPKTVAARSKACVCSRSLPGIAVSNPAGGMNICLRMNVVCHQGEFPVTGRSPVQRSPTEDVCV
jgi:hypothetical protein